jgi:hypothetical protein
LTGLEQQEKQLFPWEQENSWKQENQGRSSWEKGGRKESLVEQAAGALGLDEGKASGEVLRWLDHPATLALAHLLACLHTLTGVDLLTAFGLLLTIVCLLCLLLLK